MLIDARSVVGLGTPSNDGQKLARYVLKQCPDLQNLEINVCYCSAALLISSFFLSFLSEINSLNPELLSSASQISWIARHQFQQDNIARWMGQEK